MATLAWLFFWGYALMLVGVGASGLFIAPWELRTVFGLPLGTLPDIVEATLLNQYRFLKSLELAFGIFCLAWRHEIFRRGRAHTVFVAGVVLGVSARLGSWAINGRPQTTFLIFAALELITVLLVAWAVHQRLVLPGART